MTPMQIQAKARAEKIRDMRAANVPWEDIALEFGLQADTCETYYRRGIRKYGVEPAPTDQVVRPRSTIVKEAPTKAGEFIARAAVDSLDDPRFKVLREAMVEAGMTPKMIEGFMKRLKSSLAPVVSEAKRLTVEEMTKALESKISAALEHVDEYAMGRAGLKDLAIFLNIAIEKHQLLSNRPTHIIDFTSRQQINVLLPAMMAEARRRGLDIQGSAVRVADEGQA